MSTDDTVNAFMRDAGELAGARHRAEKAEARIAELELERDEALASVKKLAKCAGLDGTEPIAELSTYIQQLQRDLRGVHTRLCGSLGVGAGLLEDLTDAVAHIRMGYNAANAELAALRQCSTCCGTPHASGLPCICGGTNKAEDEVKNLRLESMVLRDAVVRMGEELRAKEEEPASAKLGLEELPYEPECSVQRLDNWSAVDRQKTLTLPAWIVEDVKEWAVITDCEGDFVALVANDKADLIGKVLNEAGQER